MIERGSSKNDTIESSIGRIALVATHSTRYHRLVRSAIWDSADGSVVPVLVDLSKKTHAQVVVFGGALVHRTRECEPR